MPSEKTINTIRQATTILSLANPAIGALVPLVFSIVDSIRALKGGSERELTPEEQARLVEEARAALAQFQIEVTKAHDQIHDWLETHPPTTEVAGGARPLDRDSVDTRVVPSRPETS